MSDIMASGGQARKYLWQFWAFEIEKSKNMFVNPTHQLDVTMRGGYMSVTCLHVEALAPCLVRPSS